MIKFISTQKNLEQSKYQNLMENFQPISDEVGYDVIEARYDEIIPVEDLESDSQKIVIFDDYVIKTKNRWSTILLEGDTRIAV